MARILLMVPRVEYRPQPPLGLAYLAVVLEKDNHQVRIYDPFDGDSDSRIRVEIECLRPDIVGITCVTPQKIKALHYAKTVKGIRSDCHVVIGGPHPTVAPFEMLNDENVDIVVIGEGENTMRELVSCLNQGRNLDIVKGIAYKKDGHQILTNPRQLISNLDNLPFPARHLLNMKWYSRRLSLIRGKWLRCGTMVAARGCPFNCIFCSGYKIFGRKIRQRSPENIVKEARCIVQRYSLDIVLFVDDTFTLDRNWLIELCDRWRRDLPSTQWACQGKIGTVKPELVRVMRNSGCIQLEFGVESGSQRVLDIIQKNQRVSQIKETFAICRNEGIRTMANFVIGNPGETMADIELTEKLAREIKADYTEFYILTPYPGTEIHRMARERGWLRPGQAFYGRESVEPIMEINLSRYQLVKLRKELYEKCLLPTMKGYLSDINFLFDVLKFTLFYPYEIVNYLKIILRERNLAELGRYINEMISRRLY